MSLLLSQTPSTFNPATGFPYEQCPGPPAHSVAPRATALLLVACSFVFVPPPVDPSAVPTWLPDYPDFAERAAPRAPSLLLDAEAKPPAQFGRAVRFSGANQNNGLTLTSQLFGPTNFTIGGWYYNPTLPGLGLNPALWCLQDTLNDSVAPTNFISVVLEHDGTIDVLFTGNAETVIGNVSPSKWTYVLLSVGAGGNATAYLGTEGTPTLATAAITGLNTTFTPLSLTFDTANFDYPFNGRLWGWRAWNTALSAGEAAAEFSSFYAQKTPSLLGQWQFEHATTKLVDTSGNGRTLAAIGAGTWLDEEGPFLLPGNLNPQFGFPYEQQQFPDFARGPQRPVNEGGQAVEPVFPQPNFDSNHPSWLPEYPDMPGRGPQQPTSRSEEEVAVPPFQLGTAVEFGSDSGLEITSNLPGPTNFTVSCFLQIPIGVNVTADATIWMLQDTHGSIPTNYINIEVGAGGTDVSLAASPSSNFTLFTAKKGVWYFVAASVSTGGTIDVYWAEVGAPALTHSTQTGFATTGWTPLSFTVGDDYFDEPWPGAITDVIVWNAPRSASDLLAQSRLGPASQYQTNQFQPAVNDASLTQWWKLEHAATKLHGEVIGRDLTTIGPGPWSDVPGPFLQPGVFNPYFGADYQQQPGPVQVSPRANALLDSGGGCDFVFTPTGFDPSAIPSWQPEFPDFVSSLEEEVGEQTTFAFVPLVVSSFDPSTSPSWLPSFPDFARGRTPLVNVGQSIVVIEEYEPTDWFPSFDDFARAPARAVELREQYTFVDSDFMPKLAWSPSYPDFARSALRPVNEGGVFRTHVEYEPTDWFPSYADFAYAAQRATELREQYAFVDPDFVPKLAWLPTFPDFARTPLRVVNEGTVFRTHVEYEPTDWFPSFDDFARSPARATELREGYAFVDPDFIPKLAWAPSFPDFANGKTPLVREGGFALTIEEREPQLDWLSTWPDFPGRTPARAVNEGGQAPFDNFDFSPKLSWSPIFTDFPARATPRPVNEGGVFRTHVEYEPTDWFPYYQDFVTPAPRALELREGGSSYVNPEFVPYLSWAPSYPDFAARAAPRPINTGGLFWTNLEREPTTDWISEFPDFPGRGFPRAINEGGQAPFDNVDFVARLSWSPSFPDFARAQKPLVPEGAFALVIEEREPVTDWLPSYPDFARSAPRPVNQGGLTWTNVEYEPTDWFPCYPDFAPAAIRALELRVGGAVFIDRDIAPALSWAPSYPDFPARAALKPVNQGGLLWTNVEYEPTDWFPYYQDFVTPAPRALELREGGAVFIDLDVAPRFSWAPSFPDFAGRTALRPVNTGGLFWTNLEREPTTDWSPIFPDFAGRAALRPVNEGGYTSFDNFDFVAKLSWAPSYPDFAARTAPRPVNQGGEFRTHLEYEPTDWFPYYQDFVTPAPRAVELRQGEFSFVNAELYPQLSWAPSYPDFARAAPSPLNTGGLTWTNVEYEPTDWFPYYQDFVPAPARALELREGGPRLVEVDSTPYLSWAPSFPDFALAVLRPVNQGGLTWTNLEYEPTDWFPNYPDFATAATRAVELREGGSSFDNFDFVSKLSWSPSYPDFARSAARPVNQGGEFRTHVEYEPTDWFPYYQDFVTPAPRALELREGGSSYVDLDITPPLAWAPSYPDFAARAALRPVNQGGEFRTHLEYEPTDWFPAYPDFAPSAQRAIDLREGYAFLDPDYVPKLAWTPTFADFAQARAPLVSTGFFALVIEEREPAVDWLPEFVDFARGPQRPVNEGGIFRTHLEYEPTDWFPSFDDFARAPTRPVNVGGQAPFVSLDVTPKLAWAPSFPDFARGPKSPVNEGGAFKAPFTPLFTFFQPFYPDYPDFARAAPRPVNTGGLFWTNLEREPIVDWLPEFPDFARAPQRPVNTGGAFAPSLTIRAPLTDWMPEYPDFARGPKPLVNTGLIAFVSRDVAPKLSWAPSFPDFAGRAALRPVNQGGLFWTNLEREPSTDWLPEFPDFPGRAAPRPVNTGGQSWTNLEREPTTDWSPIFPDFARAAARPVNTGGLFWTNLEREPTTDWSPIFPDFARATPRPVNQGGLTWTNLEHEPTVDWLPEFPDFARTKPFPVNQGGLTWTNVEYEPTTDWLPSYPDFARAAPRPVNEGGAVFESLDFVPRLAWSPSYPDFPARAAQTPVNEGGSASFVDLDTVPPPSLAQWYPDFPDFVYAARRVRFDGNTYRSFVTPPGPPPPKEPKLPIQVTVSTAPVESLATQIAYSDAPLVSITSSTLTQLSAQIAPQVELRVTLTLIEPDSEVFGAIE